MAAGGGVRRSLAAEPAADFVIFQQGVEAGRCPAVCPQPFPFHEDENQETSCDRAFRIPRSRQDDPAQPYPPQSGRQEGGGDRE